MTLATREKTDGGTEDGTFVYYTENHSRKTISSCVVCCRHMVIAVEATRSVVPVDSAKGAP